MENQTILVTGGAGYIGSWVTKYLLEKGNTVRVSVRDKSKKEKYINLFEIEQQSSGKLELWEANLITENGFDEVVKGCDAIIHLASPFVLDTTNPQENLINPALKGTQNVLNAATKSGTVKRVILTSSIAAIHGDNVDMTKQNIKAFTENQWNTTSTVNHQPYSYSKMLAEKEAWNIYENQTQWELAVINPGFVMGSPLTKKSNSGSLSFLNDILSGKFKMGAPDLQFGFVDVRDVAKAHILALENKKIKGRHIVVNKVLNVIDYAKMIETSFTNKYKLPKMKVPKALIWVLAPAFGITRKFVANNVGYKIAFDNSKSIKELGLSYTPIKTSIKEMVEWYEKNNTSN